MYRQNFSTPKKHHKQSFLKINRIYKPDFSFISQRYGFRSPHLPFMFMGNRGDQNPMNCEDKKKMREHEQNRNLMKI